jgi:hypothetical protein
MVSGLTDLMSASTDKATPVTYTTKSAIAAFASLIVVYGGYFAWAWPPGHPAGEVLAHMIGAAILMTMIMVALEIAIAINSRRAGEPPGRIDERDTINGLRSVRNGYYALIALVWCVPFVALAGASPILLANLCLGMLAAAEAVHFGSRIVYGSAGA